MKLDKYLEMDIKRFLDEKKGSVDTSVSVREDEFAILDFKKDYEKEARNALDNNDFSKLKKIFLELLNIYKSAPTGSSKKRIAKNILKNITTMVNDHFEKKEKELNFIDVIQELKTIGLAENLEALEKRLISNQLFLPAVQSRTKPVLNMGYEEGESIQQRFKESSFETLLGKSEEEKVKEALETDISSLSKSNQNSLKDLIRQIDIVYKISYKFQIDGEKVETKDKIFSIYEEHTDIISKGIRETVFGHKINLATGKSNLFLYCKVEEGNPSDKLLFEEPLIKIEENYKDVKKATKSTATDGGYATIDNKDFAISKGIVNIVFTKIVGSLKSGLNLGRVTWKGLDMFNSKVFWSVIAYNIRVLTGHILKDMKIKL